MSPVFATAFQGHIEKAEVTAQDIRIPKVIFENILKDIKADSVSVEPVYLFQPLEVVLESESENHPIQLVKYQFLNGGGRVDLQNKIQGQGSFYFYFPSEQFEKLPNLEHLYFMSEYPQKKIDHENFGLGCGRWIDLKNKFSNFKTKNVKLNTTQQRYLYVAGGYYVFVFRKSNQVYLTHLHLTDSNYLNLRCPDQEQSSFDFKLNFKLKFKNEAIYEHAAKHN